MPTEVQDLRDNAERCRRLARVSHDENTRKMLEELALQFDAQADALQRSQDRG